MEFTSLCSGSSGNCLYIAAGSARILVDAGCSCRYLESALAALRVCPAEITALILTHEHSDHISGAARISRRYDIPIYASELTWENLPFRQDFFAWERHICQGPLEIGELSLDFFPLSHDAAEPLGLTARQNTRGREYAVGVVTDTGCVTPAILEALWGVDALILEANHSVNLLSAGPYPAYLKRRIASEKGHLSNTQAAELLLSVGHKARTVLLAHLSSQNNNPRTAVAEFNKRLQSGIGPCQVLVAPRKEPHPLITLP